MKRLLALSVMIAGVGLSASADPVTGLWRTEAGDEGGYLHVRIAPCGDKICGTIDKAVQANGQVSSDYEHLGKRMLWDMQPGNGGRYSGGRIWAPDADKTYRSKMALSGNSLKVSGCVGPICRGQTWSRLQ